MVETGPGRNKVQLETDLKIRKAAVTVGQFVPPAPRRVARSFRREGLCKRVSHSHDTGLAMVLVSFASVSFAMSCSPDDFVHSMLAASSRNDIFFDPLLKRF